MPSSAPMLTTVPAVCAVMLTTVALHVGVVGVLVPARDQQVPQQPRSQRDQRPRGDDQQRALALAVFLRRGRRCGIRDWVRWSWRGGLGDV
jgi:hypothetical protein